MLKGVPGSWGTCADVYLITFPKTFTSSYLLQARALTIPLWDRLPPLFLRCVYINLTLSSRGEMCVLPLGPARLNLNADQAVISENHGNSG